MAKLGRYSADRKKVKELTAAHTVSVAECGTYFMLNSATEFAVTLPNASEAGSGWWARFYVVSRPQSADYTVEATVADGDNMYGVILSAEDAAGSGDTTTGGAVDVITFKDGKARQGDFVEVMTDGTNWYTYGAATEQDGITYD
jgi:hypothetical protein